MGQGANLREAWDKAFATDKQAPFGGIIAVNQPLDGPCAAAIAEIFSEVIVAPEFTPEALEILQKKKNLRLLQILKCPTTAQPWDVRSVGADSFLLQQRDLKATAAADLKIVTQRQPTEAELKAMLFGWRVVKHLKSNAILYCGADRTLGTGAGQMSRVDSSRIAVWKAGEAKLPLAGSVVCSDAFFPFPDGLLAAADAGATAADSTRRFGQGRGSDCRCGCARLGHGLHRHSAFPALSQSPGISNCAPASWSAPALRRFARLAVRRAPSRAAGLGLRREAKRHAAFARAEAYEDLGVHSPHESGVAA